MALTGHPGLDELLDKRRVAGRHELAGVMRTLTDGAGPASAPERAWFEPRLFARLAQGGLTGMAIDQLLFDPDRDAVAITDDAGVAVFPGIGHIATGRPAAECKLRYDAGRRVFTVLGDGGGEYPLEPSAFVPGTRIELAGPVDPVLRRFLDDNVEAPERLEPVAPEVAAGGLARAVELVTVVRPELAAALIESVRSVLVFRHPGAESFAALGMHGMIFINLDENRHGSDAAFLLEHLVHQGGHVLFSEATLARPDFFRVDPDAALADCTPATDRRTVYDLFHGLFTEHVETQVFAAALAAGRVPAADRPAFEAHLAAVSGRHTRDLELLAPHAGTVFTPLGNDVHTQFGQAHEQLRNLATS
ncbi:hypothetical protein [Dactylosporangium sp. NPDC051541]|uniref:hypothetical protein n=1 Tax=Dactylosporangium sp. NPDC051541 TaxID=3363977 RepID=UPI0037A24544